MNHFTFSYSHNGVYTLESKIAKLLFDLHSHVWAMETARIVAHTCDGFEDATANE